MCATFGTQQFLPQPRDSRTFQAFDAVSFFTGRTTLKAGIDYVHTKLEGSLPLYFAGLYQDSALSSELTGLPISLTALDAFGAGLPLLFVQGFGDPSGEASTDQVAAFAQAEWMFGSRLLVRAGLRYDYESRPTPSADSNNWAPSFRFPGRRERRGASGEGWVVSTRLLRSVQCSR